MCKCDEKIKSVFWIVIDILVVVLVVLGVMGGKALLSYENSLPATRTITVSAEGKVVAIPDIATVSFSNISEGSDPEKITTESNTKINKAMDFVKSQGIEAKDIQTTSYSLYPKYEYDEKTRESFISGYTITQTVQIKIRDFTKIGKIIGGLPSYGINNIGSLSFGIDDQDIYLNQARGEAFAKAAVKAKDMAKQNNVKIKKVVTFSESQSGRYYPVYEKAMGAGDMTVSSVAPQIAAGSQEVTVNVSVTYEIK